MTDNPSLKASVARELPLREQLTRFGFPAATVLLLAANLMLSYALGQSRTMYDNPIYRWRESISIAFSRMNDKPLHGYLAYRSIRNYLAQNGLGLMDGEAAELPTGRELHALIYDPKRLETLLQEAARAPIDESLPPVTLAGNEKGLSDYYYFAFRLFGINLTGLWLFYFLLLSISAALFFFAFRQSRFILLLLLLYLIAHLFMVDYARHGHIQTVHNSRFFPVLAVLPSMHLLLLMPKRARATGWTVAAACAQALLLYFVVFCRVEAIWQVFALLAVGLFGIGYRGVWSALQTRQVRWDWVKAAAQDTWPIVVVGIGFVGFLLYSHFAQDRKIYGSETRSHVFWHPLYSGTVSASPQLMKLYSFGEAPYSDAIVYMRVLADLRARNDASSQIAYVHDGAIQINPMKNMGVYDRLVRALFFQVVAQHPFLVLKSYAFDKPIDQVVTLWHGGFFAPPRHAMIVPLGVAAALLFFASGGRDLRRSDVSTSRPVILIVAAFSLLPALVVSSPLIVDTLVFLLILLLLAITYLSARGLQSIGYSAEGLQSHRIIR